MRVASRGDLKCGSVFPALKQISFLDVTFGQGHFAICIRPVKMNQTCVQMFPNIICDTFHSIIDLFVGWMLRFDRNGPPGLFSQQFGISASVWLKNQHLRCLQFSCFIGWGGAATVFFLQTNLSSHQ